MYAAAVATLQERDLSPVFHARPVPVLLTVAARFVVHVRKAPILLHKVRRSAWLAKLESMQPPQAKQPAHHVQPAPSPPELVQASRARVCRATPALTCLPPRPHAAGSAVLARWLLRLLSKPHAGVVLWALTLPA